MGPWCWRCRLRLEGCTDIRRYGLFHGAPNPEKGPQGSEGPQNGANMHAGNGAFGYEVSLCRCGSSTATGPPAAEIGGPVGSTGVPQCPECRGLCWLDCGGPQGGPLCLLDLIGGPVKELPLQALGLARVVLIAALRGVAPDGLLQQSSHPPAEAAAAAAAAAAAGSGCLAVDAVSAWTALNRPLFHKLLTVEIPRCLSSSSSSSAAVAAAAETSTTAATTTAGTAAATAAAAVVVPLQAFVKLQLLLALLRCGIARLHHQQQQQQHQQQPQQQHQEASEGAAWQDWAAAEACAFKVILACGAHPEASPCSSASKPATAPAADAYVAATAAPAAAAAAVPAAAAADKRGGCCIRLKGLIFGLRSLAVTGTASDSV